MLLTRFLLLSFAYVAAVVFATAAAEAEEDNALSQLEYKEHPCNINEKGKPTVVGKLHCCGVIKNGSLDTTNCKLIKSPKDTDVKRYNDFNPLFECPPGRKSWYHRKIGWSNSKALMACCGKSKGDSMFQAIEFEISKEELANAGKDGANF